MDSKTKTIAVIIAHPDDETLWAGGTILMNPGKQYFVASLCRKTDADRAPKFKKATKALGATGIMGDLDDGPTQTPLPDEQVETSILDLLPGMSFDLIITHSIYGEYTRHRRHEETGRAVINLWSSGRLQSKALWTFAFEDGGRVYYPAAIKEANLFYRLPQPVWQKKYNIIREIYGFAEDSWEAQATPKDEAFRQFYNAAEAKTWLNSAQNTL
jgi:LmbE family N-acetylglucosaminyl deacetylase